MKRKKIRRKDGINERRKEGMMEKKQKKTKKRN